MFLVIDDQEVLMSVQSHLSLTLGAGPLRDAECSWPLWQRQFAPLAGREFPRDAHVFMASDHPDALDGVLLCLARLGSVDGEDDRSAAALLCWLVLPGVSAWAGRFQSHQVRPDLDHLVAAALWQRARTVNWRTGWKVAANPVRNVAKDVTREYHPVGLTLVPVGGPTDLPDTAAGETPPDSAGELAEVLAQARDAGALSRSDLELVGLLLCELRVRPTKTLSSGVMSLQTTRAVGARLGIHDRTVRARVTRLVRAIRAANTEAA